MQLRGDLLVSGAADRKMHVWNIATGQLVHNFADDADRLHRVRQRTQCLCVCMRVHARVGACPSLSLPPSLCAPRGADRRDVMWAGQGAITCLQFDDYKVVTGSDDGSIKLWDMKLGRYVRDLLAGETVIWRVQFDATRLAAAYEREDGSSEVLVMDFDDAPAVAAAIATAPRLLGPAAG
jgi:WD40 repeat protein